MSLHLDVSPRVEARFNAVVEQKGIAPEQLLEEMLNRYFPVADGSEPSERRSLHGVLPQLAGLTEEDFKIAEFHGDPDDGLDWTGC